MVPRAAISNFKKRPSATATQQPSAEALLKLVEAAQALSVPAQSAEACSPDFFQDITPAEWAQHIVDAVLNRLICRFPKPLERCPWTGLNRNQLYEITAQDSEKRPTISTLSLKKQGARSGARFFFVGSALNYLRQVADEQAAARNTQPNRPKQK